MKHISLPQSSADSAKWDSRFLEVAKLISTWSKDPSTKVGAVIVSPNRKILSTGYNGLPRGITDSKERLTNREIKLSMVVHAEMNAIHQAERDLNGTWIYVSHFFVCSECAKHIVQSGISRVIMPPGKVPKKWQASVEVADKLFEEAQVGVWIR